MTPGGAEGNDATRRGATLLTQKRDAIPMDLDDVDNAVENSSFESACDYVSLSTSANRDQPALGLQPVADVLPVFSATTQVDSIRLFGDLFRRRPARRRCPVNLGRFLHDFFLSRLPMWFFDGCSVNSHDDPFDVRGHHCHSNPHSVRATRLPKPAAQAVRYLTSALFSWSSSWNVPAITPSTDPWPPKIDPVTF